MKNYALSRLFLFAAVSACLGAHSRAAISWSEQFSVATGPPPFSSAVIFPALTGAGYGLVGSSTMPFEDGDEEDEYEIPSAARFDAQGNLLWGVYFDAGEGATEQELIPDDDNINRVFGGYITGSGMAVVGLFPGAGGSPVYSRQVSLVAPPERTSLRFFPGSMAAVLQDRLTQIRVLTLRDTGTTAFEQEYSSPLFGVSPGMQGLAFTQDATLTQLPDRSGYILSVLMSGQIVSIVPPFGLSYSNILVTICLDANGAVRWNNRFALSTGIPPVRNLNLAADGAVIYVFAAGSLDLPSGQVSPRTQILKLNPNGSFAWGATLDFVQLPVINFGPESSILLSGLRPVTATSTRFAMARLNFGTGALEGQAFFFSAGNFNSGTVIGSSSSRIYWVMQSGNTSQFANQTSYVGSVNLNLDQPLVRKYSAGVAFAAAAYHPSNQCVLFSPFVAPSNSVGAIALNENLTPLRDCGLFTDATLDYSNTGLFRTTFALAASDAFVSARSVQSIGAAIAFAPDALVLQRAALCAGGGPAPPRLAIAPNGSGGYVLSFASATGATYQIQFTDDLNDAFTTVQTTPGTGGTITYTVPNPRQGNGFYRVIATASSVFQ